MQLVMRTRLVNAVARGVSLGYQYSPVTGT